MSLSLDGDRFLDSKGRTLLLRGVNLGGSTKLPFGYSPLKSPNDPGEISFVGRPFPLEEADSHFRRLKSWGFNVLRFLTTWEAIEPNEPGQYDDAYLSYLHSVVKKAGDYGFYVFIDPHQDVWSRWTGGDGCPGWTLDLAGFDKTKLDASEAALTLAARYPHFERMTWPNNWNRLACSTMFTLFFGGSIVAPNFKIGGEFADVFFQRHFIDALSKVAERLCDLDHVIGYDSLNEPSAGYLGIKSLSAPRPVYHCGPELNAFQSMSIPSGCPTEVPIMVRERLLARIEDRKILNPSGVSAWREPSFNIWKNHNVFEVGANGKATLLKDDYFAKVNFAADCLAPFAERYARKLRKIHPTAILFIEDQPGAEGSFTWEHDIPIVNANHWYDLLTLITRHFDPAEAITWGDVRPVRGEENVKKSFEDQIGANVAFSKKLGCPTLIGEFGVPFDLDGGKSFVTGEYVDQEKALGLYYDTLDHWLTHATLWNYTADNENGFGDQWNLEDLSIYSKHGGGRAVRGFSRPTVQASAGKILSQSFSRDALEYFLEIERDPNITAPSVIFLPTLWFLKDPAIEVSSGIVDNDGDIYFWKYAESGNQNFRARLST